MYRVEKFIDVIKTNGIKSNKDFALISPSTSYPTEEARVLASKAMDKIQNCIEKGINDGFSGNLRDYITKLTDMAVKLRDKANLRSIDEYKRSFANMVVGEIKSVDLKSPLKAWIKSTQDGLDFLMEENKAKKQTHDNELLKRSRDLLSRIDSNLDRIVDRSSKKAFVYAKQVQDVITSFRDRIFNNDINRLSVSKLEEANPILEKWDQCIAEVKKIALFNTNPPCDEKYLEENGYGFDANDSFNELTVHIYFVEKIENLKRNIENRRATLESMLDSPISKRIKEIQGDLDKLQAEKEALTKQYQMGQINEAQVKQRATLLVKRKKHFETELERYGAKEIRNINLNTKQSMNLLNVETILYDILMEKDNVAVFNIVARNTDLSAFNKLITNAAVSEEDLLNALDKAKLIKNMIMIENKRINDFSSLIDTEMEESNRIETEMLNDENEFKIEEDEEVNDFLKDITGAGKIEETVNEKEKEKEKEPEVDPFMDILL